MVAKKHVAAEIGSPLEAYMRLMFTELMASMARALRDDGLSLPALAALHLCDVRGSMTIGALGDELALPMPAASRLATALVERGLVERKESAEDRRAKVLTLSNKGRALIERVARERVAEATASMMGTEGQVNDQFLQFYTQLTEAGFTSKGKK